jgi:hypothetical protein
MDKGELEQGVKDKIRALFAKPKVYLSEMNGRLGMQEQTKDDKDDIESSIKNLNNSIRKPLIRNAGMLTCYPTKHLMKRKSFSC